MDTNTNPLSMDLTSIDTSMPLLKAEKYDLLVAKVEMTRTKDGLARMLKIELKTTTPGVSVKDEPIGAGVTIFDQLVLDVKGKMTADMIARSVASLVQAAGLSGNIRLDNVQEWHQMLSGKIVRAKVAFVPEGVNVATGKSFPPKNEINYYVKR